MTHTSMRLSIRWQRSLSHTMLRLVNTAHLQHHHKREPLVPNRLLQLHHESRGCRLFHHQMLRLNTSLPEASLLHLSVLILPRYNIVSLGWSWAKYIVFMKNWTYFKLGNIVLQVYQGAELIQIYSLIKPTIHYLSQIYNIELIFRWQYLH